jgi:leucyl/phenylalanyl-tRNA--protein transferase
MAMWDLDFEGRNFPYRNDMDGEMVAVNGKLDWLWILKGMERTAIPYALMGEQLRWFSPETRAVFRPTQYRYSLRKESFYAHCNFKFTWDRSFNAVLHGCRHFHPTEQPWLNDQTVIAYSELHQQGFGHSLEAWEGDELVAGIMGLNLGRIFFGLTLFHRKDDSGKFIIMSLVKFLGQKKFELIDCQRMTPFLKSMGAIEMDRDEMVERINHGMKFRTARGDWSSEHTWKYKDPYPKRQENPNEWKL